MHYVKLRGRKTNGGKLFDFMNVVFGYGKEVNSAPGFGFYCPGVARGLPSTLPPCLPALRELTGGRQAAK